MNIKRSAALATALLMLFSLLSVIQAAAYTNKTGVCNIGYLNVRADAGESSTWVGYLDYGDQVVISGEKYDSNGGLWYKITWEYLTGYVAANYITVTSNTASSGSTASQGGLSDSAFETYMTAQKFPDSYKPYLRQLHKNHPSWVFTAQHLGIDWSKAVAEETVVGRNLVHSGAPASWKSMAKGAYDYSSGTWYVLDSGGWVAASEEIIKYYLDPRNFLTDDYVFMFENLSYNSKYQTIDGVKNILSGTFMSGNYTCPDTGEVKNYAQTFMEAASQSGVSPYHLASRCRNEQGVYGAPQSLGTVSGYSGYFNFFDVQAFATSSMSAAQMGCKYASTYNPTYLLPWTNQYKSIIGGSIFLGTGYITKGQDTLYLQKFDMTDGGNGYFAHQYMTCVFGQANEAVSLRNAYSSAVLASAMEFKIPVYTNMPASICPKPTSTGDNNNYLRSLSVNNVTLSPSFNMYTQSYKATVGANAAGVTINASAQGSYAEVSGTGTFTLTAGDNTFKVICTAASGAKRVYTITITKPQSAVTYQRGDVNADKYITVVDALLILRYNAGKLKLSTDQLKRADYDSNGKVDVVDALSILKKISK